KLVLGQNRREVVRQRIADGFALLTGALIELTLSQYRSTAEDLADCGMVPYAAVTQGRMLILGQPNADVADAVTMPGPSENLPDGGDGLGFSGVLGIVDGKPARCLCCQGLAVEPGFLSPFAPGHRDTSRFHPRLRITPRQLDNHQHESHRVALVVIDHFLGM